MDTPSETSVDKEQTSGIFGEYHVQVDKGRIPMPSRWRDHLKSGLELALDEDERFIAGRPYPGPNLMDKQSKLGTLGARGRLTIPRAFRDGANIADVAVVVGSQAYFEIWHEPGWGKEKGQASECWWLHPGWFLDAGVRRPTLGGSR